MISTFNKNLLKSASAAITQVIEALGDDANKLLNTAHDLLRQCIEQRVLGYNVLFGRLIVAKSQIERALVVLKEEQGESCDATQDLDEAGIRRCELRQGHSSYHVDEWGTKFSGDSGRGNDAVLVPVGKNGCWKS